MILGRLNPHLPPPLPTPAMLQFLGVPLPCGIVMTRKSLLSRLSLDVEYVGTVDDTISGSRNGIIPVYLWYTLSMKGREGLQDDVTRWAPVGCAVRWEGRAGHVMSAAAMSSC